MRVPFNRPQLNAQAVGYLRACAASSHISGDGPYTKQAERKLEELTGAGRALLTTSCTDALEMAALLLDLHPGDEVIVPSFTFVSCVNAFLLRGARPVFADVRPDTLNIDAASVEALISARTKAIGVVHYAGVGCEMERLMEIAARAGVALVEDNAHGLMGRYRGRNLGTFGGMATLSFHETKNVTCGEGGALLINDAGLVERAEVLREKGTDRSRFFRGQVDKYTWRDVGSSFLPSDLLAAILCGQLERVEEIQEGRRGVFERYARELAAWAEAEGVRLPVVPEDCDQAYHMFYMLMPDGGSRDRFLTHMRERGVMAVFHYLPLHESPMGVRLDPGAQCPVSKDVSRRLVRLPFFSGMREAEQSAAIEAVLEFRQGRGACGDGTRADGVRGDGALGDAAGGDGARVDGAGVEGAGVGGARESGVSVDG